MVMQRELHPNVFAVMDGTVCGNGAGPRTMQPVVGNVLLASADQVAIDAVAAACRNHGKSWGAVTVSPEHADMLYEKGCRMLSPTSDAKLLNSGVAAVKQQFEKLFGM